MDTVVTEIDGLLSRQLTFATKLIDMSVGIELKAKEQENMRKKVIDNAHRAERDYRSQLDALKKSKDKYNKSWQDYESITAQVTKAKATNDKKLGQLATKQNKAQEAFKVAEAEYKETLGETNKKQDQYFKEEMPAILKEFNAFETERIAFLKEKIVELSQEINEFPGIYENAGSHITAKGNEINAANDISQYVTENPTNFTIPPAFQFEQCGSIDNNETNTASSASTPASSPPKKEQEHKPSQPTSHPPKQQTPPSSPVTQPQTQPQKPPSSNETPKQAQETETGDEQTGTISQLKLICKCRCLYEYKATCESELSFKKDDIAEIFEKDESGWWLAQVNGVQGYAPKNYLAQI